MANKNSNSVKKVCNRVLSAMCKIDIGFDAIALSNLKKLPRNTKELNCMAPGLAAACIDVYEGVLETANPESTNVDKAEGAVSIAAGVTNIAVHGYVFSKGHASKKAIAALYASDMISNTIMLVKTLREINKEVKEEADNQ